MKRILTLLMAVAGLFLAVSTQAQNRDFNKSNTYPSKEIRKSDDFGPGKFKRRKEMKRHQREFRMEMKRHRHHRHHHGRGMYHRNNW